MFIVENNLFALNKLVEKRFKFVDTLQSLSPPPPHTALYTLLLLALQLYNLVFQVA